MSHLQATHTHQAALRAAPPHPAQWGRKQQAARAVWSLVSRCASRCASREVARGVEGRGERSGSRRCALRRQAAWAERQPGRPASRARPLSLDDLLARIAKKEVEEVVGGWLEAARSRRMRLLLYASGVERPARGVPAMARAGPRVPAMGLQQRPKLDTQTYEMEKVAPAILPVWPNRLPNLGLR